MKKMNSFLTLALASALSITVLAGCGTGAQQGGDNKQAASGTDSAAGGAKPKMVMATSADYPPYEFHDTSSGKDEIVGFDIDIANYLAKEIGFELEVKDMDFNGLLPALQSKRVDFVMAGMTPKPERLENADFSDMYYDAKNTIVSKKGSNLKKTEDLAGKKVGVQLGSIQEGEAQELAKNIQGLEVKSLNKIPEIIQELKSNRIDAAIIEDTVAKGYTESNQDLEFNVIAQSTPAGSAVAFPKGSENVAKFNAAIKKLKDSGELDKLIKKWFEK
ncbi:transporter substrate-binding domain-containing protein [Brevibacillus fluminis]|uniref:transporter substrate-binding domain-containing protein n=1 Tax=Brevibacillus fluminis TaxID=511487 RepID=UPI003F899054